MELVFNFFGLWLFLLLWKSVYYSVYNIAWEFLILVTGKKDRRYYLCRSLRLLWARHLDWSFRFLGHFHTWIFSLPPKRVPGAHLARGVLSGCRHRRSFTEQHRAKPEWPGWLLPRSRRSCSSGTCGLQRVGSQKRDGLTGNTNQATQMWTTQDRQQHLSRQAAQHQTCTPASHRSLISAFNSPQLMAESVSHIFLKQISVCCCEPTHSHSDPALIRGCSWMMSRVVVTWVWPVRDITKLQNCTGSNSWNDRSEEAGEIEEEAEKMSFLEGRKLLTTTQTVRARHCVVIKSDFRALVQLRGLLNDAGLSSQQALLNVHGCRSVKRSARGAESAAAAAAASASLHKPKLWEEAEVNVHSRELVLMF